MRSCLENMKVQFLLPTGIHKSDLRTRHERKIVTFLIASRKESNPNYILWPSHLHSPGASVPATVKAATGQHLLPAPVTWLFVCSFLYAVVKCASSVMDPSDSPSSSRTQTQKHQDYQLIIHCFSARLLYLKIINSLVKILVNNQTQQNTTETVLKQNCCQESAHCITTKRMCLILGTVEIRTDIPQVKNQNCNTIPVCKRKGM